jgi:hypothetical protein
MNWRQLRGVFDLVSSQQHYAKLTAQLSPGGVTGSSFRHQHSHDAFMAKAAKTLAVSQHLA